jgi:hypothetical protein
VKNVNAPNAVFVMSKDEFRHWSKRVNSFHAPGAVLVVASDEQLAKALRKLLGTEGKDGDRNN